jgi:lipopolysaccharide export LptBFGC system permease protein LptF
MKRPGEALRRLARRVCSQSAMERLIDPTIADLQHECDEAGARGRVWRCRLLRLAACAAIGKLVMIAIADPAVYERTAADSRALARTVVFSLVIVCGLTGVLILPPLINSPDWRLSGLPAARLAIYLVPQAVPLALPLGLMSGILFGLRDYVPTRRVQWTIAVLAIGCSAAAFVILAWLLPAGNQAFRELMAGQRLLRGMNELTLRELAATDLVQIRRLITAETTSRFAFAFHSRLALAFAPLMLSLFSLGIAHRSRHEHGRLTMSLTTLIMSFAYYVLLYGARAEFNAGWLPPMVAGWGPNLVVLAITFTLFCLPTPAEIHAARQ